MILARLAAAVGVAAAAALTIGGCGNEPAKSATPAASAADIETAMSAAEEYLAAREYSNAEVILEKLVQREPKVVEAWETLGQVRYSQALEAEAKGKDANLLRLGAYECYSKAVALKPESAGLQHSAGMMAFTAGREDVALQHFRKAGELDPSNLQHPLFEAQVLIKKGRLDEAEAALERAHAIDEDEPFTISSLAVVAMERGERERALELIEQARAIDPKSLAFRVQEARIRRRGGDARGGIDLLQPLPAIDRSQQGVTEELAACYEAIGDFSRAAATWSHRLRAAPQDWNAALKAAEAHARAGERTSAAAMFDVARRIAPNEPAVKNFGETLAAMNAAAGATAE